MGKCQHDAGVLIGGKLSPAAKNRFIKDVKENLLLGSAQAPPLPIPCGPEFPAVPNADRIKLEDEKLYPEWHEHALGLYEQIANALDFEGQFTILPICCPISLGFALGIDVPKLKFPSEFALLGLALPLLAAKLDIIPPTDLALKFPDLLSAGLPNLPSIDFKLDPLKFPDLFKFAFPFPQFPDLLLGLMAKMPKLFLKLLSFDFSTPCDVVLESGLFGGYNPSEAIVWAITQKVLVAKTTECLTLALVGSTVGSSPGGIVGTLGREKYKYIPPDHEFGKEKPIRDLIVSNALRADGLKWSDDHKEFKEQGYDILKSNIPYTNFLMPNWISPRSSKVPFTRKGMYIRMNTALTRAQKQSSCGMFVRACYYYAGASHHPFFTEPYKPATAIANLYSIAKKIGAEIPHSAQNIPKLKRGDAIITQRVVNGKINKQAINVQAGTEHVLLLTEDFNGSLGSVVQGVEGGQTDFQNLAVPNGSQINSTTFEFRISNTGHLAVGRVNEAKPKNIGFIINGWSMVTGRPKEDEDSSESPT